MTAASDAAAEPALPTADLTRIFRAEAGRSVAGLVRAFGDMDLAEDAVQDAFAVALDRWRQDGPPPNPGGWITTTARRRAIDRLRRESRGRELLAAVSQPEVSGDDDVHGEEGPVEDGRLRLVFTCCHPALAPEAQVALTLRLLCGLSTDEVARAFLVPTPTMAQRLVRAKRKIKAARIPFRVPSDAELPARLAAVPAVVYLVYTAGADRASGRELCGEAVRLARLLATLRPDEPEIDGLLALLLLTESRRTARFAADGTLVALPEQDRDRWDRALVAEGQAIVRSCLRRDRPGPYQLQAAINAVHADAASVEDTDWQQIVVLYDHLLTFTPTVVVALNRAVALGHVAGPAAALAIVDTLDLDRYHPFHVTRGHLLDQLGRGGEAVDVYARAAALAPTEPERRWLRARASAVGEAR